MPITGKESSANTPRKHTKIQHGFLATWICVFKSYFCLELVCVDEGFGQCGLFSKVCPLPVAYLQIIGSDCLTKKKKVSMKNCFNVVSWLHEEEKLTNKFVETIHMPDIVFYLLFGKCK